MNFNQRLYLNKHEKDSLTHLITDLILKNNLTKSNVFIGGFSSGGNVSLLLSDYLLRNNSSVNLKGVFVVDSPVDLIALYKYEEKSIKQNVSQIAVNEAKWILNKFDNELGALDSSLSNYIDATPYYSENNSISNISAILDLKVRLYTEPDSTWWKENRGLDYVDMNAFYIHKLANDLKINNSKNVEYISTQNRGYRKNGERHPHSWALIDNTDLIKWILLD